MPARGAPCWRPRWLCTTVCAALFCHRLRFALPLPAAAAGSWGRSGTSAASISIGAKRRGPAYLPACLPTVWACAGLPACQACLPAEHCADSCARLAPRPPGAGTMQGWSPRTASSECASRRRAPWSTCVGQRGSCLGQAAGVGVRAIACRADGGCAGRPPARRACRPPLPCPPPLAWQTMSLDNYIGYLSSWSCYAGARQPAGAARAAAGSWWRVSPRFCWFDACLGGVCPSLPAPGSHGASLPGVPPAAYRATFPHKDDPLVDLRAQFKCVPGRREEASAEGWLAGECVARGEPCRPHQLSCRLPRAITQQAAAAGAG